MVKEVKIADSDIEYRIDYRNIKYPRLEFRTGKLELILPLRYKEEEKLIEKHKRWVNEKNKFILEAIKNSKNKKLDQRNEEELKKFILRYCKKKGVQEVSFRKMKSKWASCSSNKNLTFNTEMKYLPLNLIKYIIFHEIIHLKERRDNEGFWGIIKKEFPDYQNREKDLFVYWFLVQRKQKI